MSEKSIDKVAKKLKKLEITKNILDDPKIKVLCSAIESIPGGAIIISPLEDIIEPKLQKEIERKKENLIEQVFNGNLITIDDLNDIDFITEFRRLYEAVMKARGNKKIQYMVDLFKGTVCNKDRGFNMFEECLNELSGMSEREIDLLFELYDCRKKGNIDAENLGEMFYGEVKNKFGISKDMTDAILSKLRKTGFVIENQDIYASGTGLEYYITEYGEEMIKIILDKANDDREDIDNESYWYSKKR